MKSVRAERTSSIMYSLAVFSLTDSVLEMSETLFSATARTLPQNGIIIVVLTLEKHSNQLLSGPDIVSRGFVYVRESEDLMEEAQAIVDQAVADCLERLVSDWGKIKNIIRDSLSDFLWKRIERNPMILPIIMEV